MTFEEVFRDLLTDNNIGIQNLSKNVGIEDSVLYDYLNGSVPNIKNATKISNYFNCSLNFLMGIDENPREFAFKQTYDISLFSNRYDSLLKTNKIAHFRICKTHGLNYSSHYAWQHGAAPSMPSLIIIAKYFGTTIDYLIGRCDVL